MADIKLVYFTSCPNAEPLRSTLKELGITFTEVCQDDLQGGDLLKNYSSPAIIKDGKLVFGTEVVGAGCSVDLSDVEELRGILEL